MSVQMQQFRVVGVRNNTGEDVSIIIDAATKAAAEVKADQMGIETTHIVRIKQDEPTPDEHELFSAEALTTKRTDKLIEEVVAPQETIAPPPPAPRPQAPARPEPQADIAAITRPNYTAPMSHREPGINNVSGVRAFSFVLFILFLITAGCYFVLVHEPNRINADQHELTFGEDLFSDVIAQKPLSPQPADMRDAFGKVKRDLPLAGEPPIASDQQIIIGQPQGQAASSAGRTTNHSAPAAELVLQSVVTSHEGRFAVINGKLYKQGADVQGHKLVNVADDWVLMEKDGKQFTLQIDADNDQ